MAHYGYKVLVAEKHARLGGRFSTQEIGGFKCPTGALIIQRGTELEETFKVTGAKPDVVDCTDISWKIGDGIYPLLGKGVGKTLWAAVRNLRWHHYKFGIIHQTMIFKAMLKIGWRAFLNLFGSEDNKLVRKSMRGTISYRDWMEKYTDDPQTIQANHAIVSSLFSATDDFECPAADVFEFWTCGTPASCTETMDVARELKRNEEDLLKAFPLYKDHGRVLKWVVKDIDDDLPCMRTPPGCDIPVETPIPNRYNAGDAAKQPGWTGSPACAKNEWKVVDMVRKQISPQA